MFGIFCWILVIPGNLLPSTYSSSIKSEPDSTKLHIIHFDVGVLDLTAVESSGTKTLASGKYVAMFP